MSNSHRIGLVISYHDFVTELQPLFASSSKTYEFNGHYPGEQLSQESIRTYTNHLIEWHILDMTIAYFPHFKVEGAYTPECFIQKYPACQATFDRLDRTKIMFWSTQPEEILKSVNDDALWEGYVLNKLAEGLNTKPRRLDL